MVKNIYMVVDNAWAWERTGMLWQLQRIDVAKLYLLWVKSTIKPAPAASTGIVSGGANVQMSLQLLRCQRVISVI